MNDSNREIDIPPNPKGQAVERVLCLRESGQPIKLTISTTVELNVEDARSFEMLLDLVERLDTIQAARQGLQEIGEGKGVRFEQATAP